MIRVRIVVVRRLNWKFHWKSTCGSYCRQEFVAFAIWAYTVSDKITSYADNRCDPKWVTNLFKLLKPTDASAPAPAPPGYLIAALSGFVPPPLQRDIRCSDSVVRSSIIEHYSWRPQSHTECFVNGRKLLFLRHQSGFFEYSLGWAIGLAFPLTDNASRALKVPCADLASLLWSITHFDYIIPQHSDWDCS